MPTFKKGNELYQLLMRLLGLDQRPMEAELKALMQRMKVCPSEMTMSDLRRVAAAFLEEMDARCRSRTPRPRRRRATETPEDLAEA